MDTSALLPLPGLPQSRTPAYLLFLSPGMISGRQDSKLFSPGLTHTLKHAHSPAFLSTHEKENTRGFPSLENLSLAGKRDVQ